MRRLTRRAFLEGGALGAAGVTLTASSWGRVVGANDDVRVAIVGLNGKGKGHVEAFRSLPGVRVVALCDVDSAVLEAAARDARSKGLQAESFVDYRDLLTRSDIDAVSIVTPNHQHSLQAIWALQAGKDVFVEKPVSHNLWEGQQLVLAAQKYGRIVQAGIQSRSSPAIAAAIAWQRAGHLGKITAARALCYKRRESIGRAAGPQGVPATIHYDLWLGPAALTPLRRARFHYDWHWQWATGNGDIGNQGNHQLDVARRFLGQARLPPRVSSIGGRFGYRDDGETPNTLLVWYGYAGAPLIFEQRGLPTRLEARGSSELAGGVAAMDQYRGLSVGNIIDCEGGSIVVPAGDYSSARAFDSRGRLLREFKGVGNHYQSFIRAVKSRKATDLAAPIVEGQVSSALSHLGNVSQRVGRDGRASEVNGQLAAEPLVTEAFARMAEHLKRNGVDLERTPVRLGASLEFDQVAQRIVGAHAPAANRLLSREYRPPFVVPNFESQRPAGG
jgi:predicted dehydrogenase